VCIVGAYPAFPSAVPRFDTLESAPLPDDSPQKALRGGIPAPLCPVLGAILWEMDDSLPPPPPPPHSILLHSDVYHFHSVSLHSNIKGLRGE
jgi:hypothetical protein